MNGINITGGCCALYRGLIELLSVVVLPGCSQPEEELLDVKFSWNAKAEHEPLVEWWVVYFTRVIIVQHLLPIVEVSVGKCGDNCHKGQDKDGTQEEFKGGHSVGLKDKDNIENFQSMTMFLRQKIKVFW